LSVDYQIASAVGLSYADSVFDLAMGFMRFIGIPEMECVLAEAPRVLMRGASPQYSIAHACLGTSHRLSRRARNGVTRAIRASDLVRDLRDEASEWFFSAAEDQGGTTEVQDRAFHLNGQPVAEHADPNGVSHRTPG
jgi:hypothetical protein